VVISGSAQVIAPTETHCDGRTGASRSGSGNSVWAIERQ
jgi:hypothetical protein